MSIADDIKKWPGFEEEKNIEPQGIYRPLYVAVQVVEAAVKAKLEPPPQPAIQGSRYRFRDWDDHGKLLKFRDTIRQCVPDMTELIMQFDNYFDIMMIWPKCSLCGETHRYKISAIQMYRAQHEAAVIHQAVAELRKMCTLELGPAGKTLAY